MPWSAGLGRLLPAPAGGRPFPTLFPLVFSRVPGPILRRPRWCLCSFLPIGHRLCPHCNCLGDPHKPARRGPCGPQFRSCSHSFTFRLPGLLATQVVATAALSIVASTSGSGGLSTRFPLTLSPAPIARVHTSAQSARVFSIGAYRGSLGHRVSDMLTVRIEQLTVRGLPPR